VGDEMSTSTEREQKWASDFRRMENRLAKALERISELQDALESILPFFNHYECEEQAYQAICKALANESQKRLPSRKARRKSNG